MINYKKKYLKYKKKYLQIKKITGGENSKIKDYFNNVKNYFYNKICDNHNFCENITGYRVVYNDVYFYNNNNGKMVKSNEIATLNNTWDGTLVFIDNNIYVDLGMNEYIPVFDKETGDVLVVSHNKKCLPLKKDCGNDRNSTPITWIKMPENFINMPPPPLNTLIKDNP
tara:strand:- start:697 stop:1203 length:507 start_codon:yes stop_codon:yes gene_type:complete